MGLSEGCQWMNVEGEKSIKAEWTHHFEKFVNVNKQGKAIVTSMGMKEGGRKLDLARGVVKPYFKKNEEQGGYRTYRGHL